MTKMAHLAILNPLNGIFMLILHSDPERVILEAFKAKFGRFKFSFLTEGHPERDQNDNFKAKITHLTILTLLN